MSTIFYDDFRNGYNPFAGKKTNVAHANINKKEEIYSYSSAMERDDLVDRKRFFKKMNLGRALCHHNSDWHALALVEKYTSDDMKLKRHRDYFSLIDSLVSFSVGNSGAYTVSDMVGEIKKIFGLSTANIAIIVGVSRATIYNHISCSSSVDVSEYQNLFHLAKAVEQRGYNVSKGLKSVSVDGKTLLKHLTTEPFEFEKLIEICKVVSFKLANMNIARTASIYDQKLTSIISNK